MGISGIAGPFRMVAFVACLVLVFLDPQTASAARKLALVVGNDAYDDVTPLKKAVNDARAVGTALSDIGFDVTRGENLTRREMIGMISKFTKKVERGDVVFFFYAGHGVSLEGRNILLSTDISSTDDEDLVRSEGHSVDDIMRRLSDSGAAVSLLVLDACRNNPFEQTIGRSIGTTRGLSRTEPPGGAFVLMSAAAGQEALDRLSDDDPNPNSVFTRNLLPLLREPGLNHVQMAKRLQVSVSKEARKVDHDQKPAYYDEILGDFVLNDAAPAADAPAAVVVPPKADPCSGAAEHYAASERRNTVAAYRSHVVLYRECAFAGLAEDAASAIEASAGKPQVMASLPTQTEAGATASAVPLSIQAEPPIELARETQIALNELGCTVGTPDGAWGQRSRDALKRATGGLGFEVSEIPTAAIHERLKRETSFRCKGPASQADCASGQVYRIGSDGRTQCVAVPPAKRTVSADRPAAKVQTAKKPAVMRAPLRKATPPSKKGGGCFEFDGERYCE